MKLFNAGNVSIIIAILLILIFYINIYGINTTQFNSFIKKEINSYNNKLDIELKKVKLFREIQEKGEETIIYEINLDNFYKSGDRSEFVRIMPNDTIIIEEKLLSTILRKNNTLTSLLQLINIFIILSEE